MIKPLEINNGTKIPKATRSRLTLVFCSIRPQNGTSGPSYKYPLRISSNLRIWLWTWAAILTNLYRIADQERKNNSFQKKEEEKQKLKVLDEWMNQSY